MSISRLHPRNKVIRDYRYVYFRGVYLKFPKSYGYFQYLIEILAPHLFGSEFLDFNNKKVTKLSLYLRQYIFEMLTGPKNVLIPVRHRDLYVLELLNDLETLLINGVLDKKLLFRLNRNSENEVRGAIYEVNIAAAFVRAGHKIRWLHEESRPEFETTDNPIVTIEAKRRHRKPNQDFVMDTELRAIKRNLWDAKLKKRTQPLLVFMDTDLPPRTSKVSIEYNRAIALEIGNKDFDDVGLILSNQGYDSLPDTVSDGNNSFMIIRGNNIVNKSYINYILENLFSSLPGEYSDIWVL